jgi:hypothetical protein
MSQSDTLRFCRLSREGSGQRATFGRNLPKGAPLAYLYIEERERHDVLKRFKGASLYKVYHPSFYKNLSDGMSLCDGAGLRHIPLHPDEGSLSANNIKTVYLVQGIVDIAPFGLVGHHDDGDRLLYLSPLLYDRGDADIMLPQDPRDGGEDAGAV